MARVIGFVKSLQNGTFSVKDAQGAIRELKAGDQIFQNELVYGSPNNPQNAQIIIDVAFADAKDITLSGSAQLYTDLSVLGGAFEKEEAIVSKDSVESAWKLSTGTPNLEGQVDSPAAGLEETAAGVGLSDSERAGGPVFDARTGAAGDVTTTTQSTVNGTLNPNLAGPDTQNLNDRPVVADVAETVYEARGPSEDGELTKFSGQLVAADPDVGDTHTFFAVEGTFLINGEPAPEGVTLVLNEDGRYSVIGDFNALAIGENAIITFQYYAVDNGIDVGAPHESLPATVTITIQGTNDQPVVSDINANGGSGEVAVEEFSEFGPASGITIQVNGHDVTTSNQNGYYYSTGYNGMYGVSSYALEINGATADAVITFPYEVESFSFRAGAVNGSNENIRVLYTDGSTETIHIADNVNSSSSYEGHQYTTLISATAPTGKMISGFIILDGTDYWLLDGITFNGSRGVYETHDNGEVSPLVNDGNNILSGNLSVIDDDTTDTHTFRVVDESVNIVDVSEAGIDLGDVSVSISKNDEGVWQYNINGNFTELAAGESATVTFQYVADDGHGFDGTDGINESSVSAPKTITLTITGTNDQPVVSDINVNAGTGDGESIVGLDTLSLGRPSGGHAVFGQVFIATETALGKVEFNLIGDNESGQPSAYTVEIRNALNEVIYSNNGSVANGSNIVTLDSVDVGLTIGEKYLVRIVETSGNIEVMYSNGNENDAVGAMFVDSLTDYLQYDIGIRLTYGSGGKVIYEVPNGNNTFTGQLEVTDDDTNDTHTFFGVLNDGDNGDGVPAARMIAPVEPSIAYELNSPTEGVRIESITVYEDGRYTIQGDFNALAAGQSATVTFQYYAVDSSSTQVNGESNTSEIKTVTMTITGTNDQPVVSDVTTTQNEALNGTNTFAGKLEVTDDDEIDTHTFSMSGTPSVDSGLVSGLNVSLLANGDYTVTGDFNKLAAGESATVTFQYYAVDNSSTQANGESNTSELKTVTLIVTGTNDQPVVSDININTPLSFGGDNWFVEGNGLTITGYENNGSVVTPILHEGGLGIGSGWGEDSQINDQLFSAEAIVFGFEKAFNTATIELTSLNQETWFNNAEKAEWIAYKDGVEVGRGILTAQSGADIFTIHTTSDFNSLKIAPPLDWETDSFYVKSLNVSKTFYESDTPVMSTFTGNLDAIVADDDASDEHTFALYGDPSAGSELVTDLGVVVNPDGSYSVTGNFNALAVGEKATVTFQYVAIDDSGVGAGDANNESSISAPKTVTLTITGTNDLPILASEDSTGSVQEDTNVYIANDGHHGHHDHHDAPSAGILQDTGVIAFTDVDLSDTHTVSVASNRGALGTLTAVVSENNDGDGVGSVTWTYSVNNASVQYLAADETRVETFTITVRDNNGATDTQEVKVTITGTNDVPVLASEDSHGSVKEDTSVSAGVLKDTGVIAFADVDLSDTHTVSVAPNAGALGTLTAVVSHSNDGDGVGSVTWTYSVSNASVQYLAANETRVETFTITVRDNNGATDTQEVKVTITGTNDVPVLASEDSAGSVQEDVGLAAGVLKDTGVIAFTDVDLSDTHIVSVAPNAGALGTLTAVVSQNNDGDGIGSVTWTYSVNNASVQYLAENETRVETFTITVRDNNGATDTQEVKVTITGTNDVPVITNLASALVGAVTEDASATTVSGQLAASDVDTGATKAWSIVGTPSTTYGTIGIDSTGKWTYTLNNALSTTQALGVNDHVTQTYTARVTDDKGAFVDQTITVTINGAYDAPVVTAHANDDHIITNAGTRTFVVPEWALLANDTGATDITDVSNDQNLYSVTLNPGSISVTDWDLSNIGSFDYTANGATAEVTVDQKAVGQWSLDGTNNNEIVIGNNFGSKIDGKGGADILIGGSSDDTFVYDSADIAIDGAAGRDTLRFDTNATIDFNGIANGTIKNVEVLDLTNAKITITNLSLQDVIDMTDSANDLYIKGTANDNVSFLNEAGKTWTHTAGTGANAGREIYTNSGDPTVLVKVDHDIKDTII